MKMKASEVRPVDGLCASFIDWGQRLRSDSHDPGYEHPYSQALNPKWLGGTLSQPSRDPKIGMESAFDLKN